MEKLLISACLLGQRVRYDGRIPDYGDSRLIRQWQDEGRVVPFCPEIAGGLSVPRSAAEIQSGDGGDVLDGMISVATKSGLEVSAHFVAGARLALEACQAHGIVIAVLKENSPSCGVRQIHDGSFSGTMRTGQGVTTALLRQSGITVFSEYELNHAAEMVREAETCVS